MNWRLYHVFREDERFFLWSGYRLCAWQIPPAIAAVFERQLVGKPAREVVEALQATGFSQLESIEATRRAQALVAEDQEAFPERKRPDYYTHAVDLTPRYDLASVIVAGACNLRCSYCWNSGGTYANRPQLLTRETASAVVRFLVERADRKLHVRFYGGEPLLNEPVIRQMVLDLRQAADDRGFRLAFSISTNGTLLNKENCAFLRTHDFDVGVSVDGGPEIMGEQRPSTSGTNPYARVSQGIDAAREAGVRLEARLTLTRRFASSWLNHVAHVLSLGAAFESIQIEFVNEAGPFAPPGLEVPVDVRTAALDDYAAYLLAYHRRNGALPRVFMSPFPVAWETLTAPKYSWRACAAGTSRVCIGADGAVYPCVAFSGTPGAVLGNVRDPSAALLSLRVPAVGDIPKCGNCFLKYACLGGCFQEMLSCNPALGVPLSVPGSCPQGPPLNPPDSFCQPLRHAYRKASAVLCTIENRTLPG